MARLAKQGAIVVVPDLPCFGRSDGLFAFIPHWWAWVDIIWEMIDTLVPRVRKLSQKRLKIFASGVSLGGGLAACLAVQRPIFFDGMIFIAPLIFVHDHVKPPWIVQQIFKHFLAKLLPTLPLSPTKDLPEFGFRDPDQGPKYAQANPLSMRGCKPRLGTALELGFTFPDWMKRHLSSVRPAFLVLHGSADRVTDPALSQCLYDKAPSKDKGIKLYEGGCHQELLGCTPGNAKKIGCEFSPEQVATTDECLKDMKEWLASRS